MASQGTVLGSNLQFGLFIMPMSDGLMSDRQQVNVDFGRVSALHSSTLQLQPGESDTLPYLRYFSPPRPMRTPPTSGPGSESEAEFSRQYGMKDCQCLLAGWSGRAPVCLLLLACIQLGALSAAASCCCSSLLLLLSVVVAVTTST
jgi:hypothetical protein